MTREEAIYEIKQLAVLSTNKNIEHITEALNMAIEALQDEIWKDEPCDKCVFVKGSGWCDNCNGKPKGLDALPNSRKAEQTEPTISKMEQVDKDINVRSKDEPQTNKDFKVTYTCSFTDCKNFGFNEKCIECKRKQSEARLEDEPKTEDDKKHCVFCKWVYEPNVCGRCRNMNLFADAIEDEPQTDCAWK